MTRREQLDRFLLCQELLFGYARLKGIPIRQGDAYRTPAQAAANAAAGTGIANSEHTRSLAVDIWIDPTGKDPIYTPMQLKAHPEAMAQYHDLGKFWEALGETWGGRFTRQDLCHFEIEGSPAK
jgi:hypothetical protein